MRFPLETAYKSRLMPNVLLAVLGPRTYSQILALVDTGSEETILSYKDATLLQLGVSGMPIIKNIYGIGGEVIGLCEYKKAINIFLKDTEGKSFKIHLDKVYISSSSQGTNITIIGMDFLKENGFSLFYNPIGEAYLEKK